MKSLLVALLLVAAKQPAIDLSGKKLPPGFKGDDFVSLLDVLALPKGEFESTEEYERRIGRLADRGRLYVFVTDSEGDEFGRASPEFVYNADDQVFSLIVEPVDGVVGIGLRRMVRGAYIGSNAFGKKELVQKVDSHRYRLRDTTLRSVRVVVKMSRSKAPQLKPNLRLVLAGRLGDRPGNPVSSESQVFSPQIGSPKEIHLFERTLDLEVLDILAFHQKTGEVLFHWSKRAEVEEAKAAATAAAAAAEAAAIAEKANQERLERQRAEQEAREDAIVAAIKAACRPYRACANKANLSCADEREAYFKACEAMPAHWLCTNKTNEFCGD